MMISTHTPLAGRDDILKDTLHGSMEFLLTRPSRDVTDYSTLKPQELYISTHTPLAGRDALQK